MKDWLVELSFSSSSGFSATSEATLLQSLRAFSPAPLRTAKGVFSNIASGYFEVIFKASAASEFDASVIATDLALRLQEISEFNSLRYLGFSLTTLPSIKNDGKIESYLIVFRDQRRITISAKSFESHAGSYWHFYGESHDEVVAQFTKDDIESIIKISALEILAPSFPLALPNPEPENEP